MTSQEFAVRAGRLARVPRLGGVPTWLSSSEDSRGCSYKMVFFDRSDGRVRFKMSFGGAVVEEYTYLRAGWPQLGTIVRPLFDLAYARVRLTSALRSSTERMSPGRVIDPYHTGDGTTQPARRIDRARDATDQPRAS